MPLGPYEDFGQCVQAQKMKGHSDESARKICGAMQQKIEGSSSSPNLQQGLSGQMSQQFAAAAEDQRMPPSAPQAEGVTLTPEQVQTLVDAAFNDDIEAVKRILSELVNVEEAPPAAQ
jgi:hypothetical protein